MSVDFQHKETKTLLVVLLTAVTMVVEIIYGLSTKSMALLADGVHMGSHVLAIGLSWLAYVLARKLAKSKKFEGDSNKLLSLSGFTSGLFLIIFAVVIAVEAFEKLYSPEVINYKEAIIVATIGLAVNIASVFLLNHDHHGSDHNLRAAYLHVLADAVTSLSAIIGLGVAYYWNISYIDSIAAIISSLVIAKWSVGLLKQSGGDLIDFKKLY